MDNWQHQRSKNARKIKAVSRVELLKFKEIIKFWMHEQQKLISIGNRKDDVCLQLHGQVSRQPNHSHFAMLDE